MWRMNCGCNPISADPFEFNIVEVKGYVFDSKVILPNAIGHDDCLREKIVQDYFNIISQLECGIKPDIETLLEEISLIDMKNNFNFNNIENRIYSNISAEEEDDFLRKSKYLSEYEAKEEKDRVLDNLGIDSVRHFVLSKREYDQLDELEKDAIYLITQ